jgi:hypothetical protein
MEAHMTIRNIVLAAALFAMPGAALAQEPVQNVSPQLHGNLAAAQELVRQAFDRITAAQRANEFDLAGHAGKAKELLRQANEQLKQAAEASNRR